MPLYVMDCPTCAERSEEIVRSWKPETFPDCETCGTQLVKADTKENLKISDYSNYWAAGKRYTPHGEVFHTAKDRRVYEEKHKIDGVHDKHRGQGKIMVEEARWQADTAAQQAGYKNHTDFRVDKRRKKVLDTNKTHSVDRRIQTK